VHATPESSTRRRPSRARPGSPTGAPDPVAGDGSLTLPESVAELLRLPDFPRAAGYDPAWVLEHHMGPNVLWLAESLTQVLDLVPGSRVLDLGCGQGLSSIFLAREFDVQVWAVDLWIDASSNWQRVLEAGEERRILPLQLDARRLPFPAGFFDAVVSLDAYHYFGTDDLYLGQITRSLAPGGVLGIVVPGLVDELTEVPAHLRPFWDWQFWSFHSPAWWRAHWERTGLVEVRHADLVPDGWRHWQLWDQVSREMRPPADPEGPEEWRMLEVDEGRTLGLSRVVARKP
jgi:cyclopropane fatty-acyl-phospholipid synthase-like methyltransferase